MSTQPEHDLVDETDREPERTPERDEQLRAELVRQMGGEP